MRIFKRISVMDLGKSIFLNHMSSILLRLGAFMCKKRLILFSSVAAVLLALTVLGAFFDYEIAKALYLGEKPTENFFGILFAFIGIIPTFVGWSFLGASILCLARRDVINKTKRRPLIALSVLLFILSFFFFCNTLMMVNSNAFSVHFAIAYPIGIAVIIGAAALGYKLSRKSENPHLLKTVLFLSAVSILVMIIIMSVKGIMDRPRFRFVQASANEDYFRSFWQSGSDLKASLASGAVSDEFASFPSGHSAYAMFAVFLFPALADYIPRLDKYRFFLFVFGFVWWALTAFSRLTVGAHYLTDVCIAGIITILSYAAVVLVSRFVKKRVSKT